MNTWNWGLQESNSPICDLMIFFHDFTMSIILSITIMVLFILFMMTKNILTNRFLLQGHTIEMIWTITPMFILTFIALPSLNLLYTTDYMSKPSLTVKCIAKQWYWTYEYTDFYYQIEFDSFLKSFETLLPPEFRLLDVDFRCILPMEITMRFMTTSVDVIHSWTIPSLSIKMDCIPGRINQSELIMNRPGLFYGQCSEICGANHSFMPVVVESTDFKEFMKWIMSMMNF